MSLVQLRTPAVTCCPFAPEVTDPSRCCVCAPTRPSRRKTPSPAPHQVSPPCMRVSSTPYVACMHAGSRPPAAAPSYIGRYPRQHAYSCALTALPLLRAVCERKLRQYRYFASDGKDCSSRSVSRLAYCWSASAAPAAPSSSSAVAAALSLSSNHCRAPAGGMREQAAA